MAAKFIAPWRLKLLSCLSPLIPISISSVLKNDLAKYMLPITWEFFSPVMTESINPSTGGLSGCSEPFPICWALNQKKFVHRLFHLIQRGSFQSRMSALPLKQQHRQNTGTIRQAGSTPLNILRRKATESCVLIKKSAMAVAAAGIPFLTEQKTLPAHCRSRNGQVSCTMPISL